MNTNYSYMIKFFFKNRSKFYILITISCIYKGSSCYRSTAIKLLTVNVENLVTTVCELT